ncbi:MAG: TVP38/TMEM64 family protein [Terriglobia bacterium]
MIEIGMEKNEHTATGEMASTQAADSSTRTEGAGKPSGQRARWRAVALLLLLGTGIGTARWLGVGEQVGALRHWIEGLGSLGPLVYAAIYAAAVVAAVPGSVLSFGAGALFGAGVGIVVVSVGATLGASLAFLVSRHLARDAVARRFAHNDAFQRLDRMTEERGAVIVALTRLIPLFPFNLLNFGFGLTRVRFATYVFWSWLCMLPGIVVFVAGTDAVVQFLMGGRVPWVVLATLAGGIVVLAGLIRFARRKLGNRESEPRQ